MERTESATGIVAGGVLSEQPHSDDLEGRIGQRSEKLYRARLVQRLFMLWAYPGNLVLIAVAAFGFGFKPSLWSLALAIVVPVVSLVLSVRLVYIQHFAVRAAERELRDARRAYHEQLLEDLGPGDLLAAHKRYRVQLPDVIEEYRAESRRDLRRHNTLQGVIIAGSIVTSVMTAASVSIEDARWSAIAVSLLVAVAASYAGYAKYRERSVSLQATGDALEREYYSVELRVGRYRRFDTEREAYAEFAHEVESLRDEQAKRQQQLGHSKTPAESS